MKSYLIIFGLYLEQWHLFVNGENYLIGWLKKLNKIQSTICYFIIFSLAELASVNSNKPKNLVAESQTLED